MKKILFKIYVLGLFIITPTLSLAQNKIMISDTLSSKAEKIHVKFPKTMWFGKRKIRVGNYGIAKIKIGGSNTKHQTKRHYEEDKTKYKLSVLLTNKDLDSTTLKSNVIKNEKYVVSSNVLLEAITGIENETFEGSLEYSKILKANIKTNKNKNELWNFILKKTDRQDVANREEGSLTNGKRTIYITQNNFDKSKNIIVNDSIVIKYLRYEFVEDGKSIGAVKYDNGIYPMFGTYWFKTDLSPSMKQILIVAMASISGYNYIYN